MAKRTETGGLKDYNDLDLVDRMTNTEVREAATFTSGKILKALLGNPQDKKLARRMLKLEKEDKAKIKEMEESIPGGPDKVNRLKNFKKLLQKLEEHPQFYSACFQAFDGPYGHQCFDAILDNFDLLEVNFEIFADLVAFLKELETHSAGSSVMNSMLSLINQVKDSYEFDPYFFHDLSKALLQVRPIFQQYVGFPERLQMTFDFLVKLVKKYPGDTNRFKTAADFLYFMVRESLVAGPEMDLEFLTDQKSYTDCCKFFHDKDDRESKDHLKLKIRFSFIGFKHPEYRDLVDDAAILSRFRAYYSVPPDVEHIFYILDLYKKGETKEAEALTDKKGNFNFVEDSKDFDAARPWVLALDIPAAHEETDNGYSKALGAYLELHKKDPTEAAAYLEAFKSLKGVHLRGSESPLGGTFSLFKLYGNSTELLKVCILWTKEFRVTSPTDKILAGYFFQLHQKNPSEALEYLEVFKNEKSCDLSPMSFHSFYKDDLVKLKLCTSWLKLLKNGNACEAVGNLYESSPDDFEKEWPLVEESVGKIQGQLLTASLTSTSMESTFKNVKNLKEVLAKSKRMEAFVKMIPGLFNNPKQEAFAKWLLERFGDLVQDQSDMDFIAQVVGRHGKTAEEIMAGYEECLKAGVITRADKSLVLEFLERFRVLLPTIMGGYKKAKAEGSHEVYCARLNDIAGRMTGAVKLSEEERKLPYYEDLLKEVYKNNVGHYTTYENNKTCEDREADLSSYKIKPRYEIDLLSQSEVSLKEGEKSDKTKTDALVASIKKLTAEFGAQGYEPEKMKSSVAKKVDEYFEKIKESCGIPTAEAAALRTEEKISLLVLDSLYGKKKVEEEDLKNLLISYEFAYFEDIRDYIQGTTDRVSRSSNPDYALLCELNTFFSDRIKEINKRVIESGFKNPAVAKVIPAYFEQLSKSTQSVERKGQIAKMQPEKLGASEAFLKQITRSLEGKTGKKYTPEEVRKLIRRYEQMTRGLPESASNSPKQRTKAFYGQLRSQREKTRQLAEFITGTEVDPRKIHLGEMNVAELLEAENSISGGTYDATQFEAYTVQKALGLFEEEKDFLTQELAKFVSAGGTERETLNAYIAKNKETANARMVGGVCVSGDNPGKVGPDCQWNMPNYFELVLEDPDTHRCMGTVLLHSFDEDGKTLTASFNPSSTYLYKVDEKALFKGLLNTLITFAEENGFKRICSSQNTGIRTNRTGGIFEKAMKEVIAEVGKTYSFSEVKRFSFSPPYEIKDMDVLWQSTATHST